MSCEFLQLICGYFCDFVFVHDEYGVYSLSYFDHKNKKTVHLCQFSFFWAKLKQDNLKIDTLHFVEFNWFFIFNVKILICLNIKWLLDLVHFLNKVLFPKHTPQVHRLHDSTWYVEIVVIFSRTWSIWWWYLRSTWLSMKNLYICRTCTHFKIVLFILFQSFQTVELPFYAL